MRGPSSTTRSVRAAAAVGSVLAFGVAVLAVVSAGCRGAAPSVDAGLTLECTGRDECSEGRVCTAEGFCAACESSGQCRLKEQCNPQTLRCELRDGWGTACQLNADCSAGRWCRQGLCEPRAVVSLCPGGISAECPQGMRCNTVNTVCEEDLGCSENADCGVGETCNTGSRACAPKCTADTQEQVCAAGERCANELCVQCTSSSDCAVGLDCDAAGRCTASARCYSDRDCKVPLVCHVPTGACLTKQPPCVSDEDCDENERCEVGTGRCVPRACQPDRYEPNESRAAAFTVTASRYLDLTLCSGDIDYFALSLSRGDQLGINVDADPFAEDTFSVRVEDESGRSLASGKFLAAYVASATAKYFVAVQTSDAYQPYDVTFLLSRGTPCDDDVFEPNDSPEQATLVNASTALDGAICPQDVDHFAVQVPAGSGVRAALTDYSSASGLLRLCVLNGSAELGCSDAVADPFVAAPSDVAGGKTLTVRVQGSAERIANTYTLQVEYP